MKNKKLWYLVGATLLVFCSAVIGLNCTGKSGTIKVGAILPLTGPTSDIGEWQRKGIEAAQAEINENGGVSGRKIEVSFEDSKGQAKDGVTAFGKLADVDKVPVIISALSSVANAVVPLTLKSRIPTMLIAVSYPGITKQSEWVVRDHPGSDDEALIMGDFMMHALKLKNIVALYCNDDFGIGSFEALKSTLQTYGGNIVWSDSYTLDQGDFKNIAAKAKSYNPEGIYIIGYTKAGVLLAKQLRELGYKGILAAPMAMSIPAFIALSAGSLEGAYFTSPAFSLDSQEPAARAFIERFHKMYNSDPNVFAGFAYDGMMMVATAMKNKGYSAQEIKDGLMELKDYPGAMGTLSVRSDRNIKFPLSIVKLDKGKLSPANVR
ncbi:MAG: ABC transporter substrate-binding protein [Candidatus Eisenbacteria bacterium]|nr:ABC transporter substrate-binding protein [Candidatus Eisenbacteria bacterium]